MTLREFVESDAGKLFYETKIHILSYDSYCVVNELDFDNRVNMRNALTSLNDKTLDKEIACISATRFDTLVIAFKDELLKIY